MDHSARINEIMKALFTPEQRRLNSVITEVNARNKALTQAKADGFLYRGKFYLPSNTSVTVVGQNQVKPTLHYSFIDEMDAWAKDTKSVNDDYGLVRQMLFMLLRPCVAEREIRDALPECLVNLIGLNKYPRSQNPGYTLRGDLRTMRQFTKLMDKIRLYSITGLLY